MRLSPQEIGNLDKIAHDGTLEPWQVKLWDWWQGRNREEVADLWNAERALMWNEEEERIGLAPYTPRHVGRLLANIRGLLRSEARDRKTSAYRIRWRIATEQDTFFSGPSVGDTTQHDALQALGVR